MNNRMAFIDFCQGLLNMNPIERWSPQQARLHPFITGEKWTKPWTVGVQVYTALIRMLMMLCSPLALRRLTLRPCLQFRLGALHVSHSEGLALMPVH